MRFGRRRAAVDDEMWDATPAEELEEELADQDADETGWQTATAHLSGFTRLARAGAWVLIASGPLLGLAALLGSSSPTQIAPAAAPVAQQAPDTGPSGFAQLYLAAYLAAGQGTESSLAPYFSGTVTLTNVPGTRTATRMVTIASREVQSGYWSVTVAADVSVKNSQGSSVDAGLQYYRVPVQVLGPLSAGGSSDSGTKTAGYVATALPAQVAAPASLTASSPGYGTDRGSNANGPQTQTIASFLNAYLAGKGGLSYYTSPGVTLQPVTPPPYTSVQITDVADDSGNASSTAVPSDGTVRQVLVQVTATDSSGSAYPLTYALTLRSRGGRWEIAALDDAPTLQTGSTPAAATPSPDSDSSDSSDGSSASPPPSGS
ncbi:MAG: conjugal transfer protein [Streptomycetaceae bacterium]|nr:conjugal transfer protein [Streptomycetaceae bacterium]